MIITCLDLCLFYIKRLTKSSKDDLLLHLFLVFLRWEFHGIGDHLKKIEEIPNHCRYLWCMSFVYHTPFPNRNDKKKNFNGLFLDFFMVLRNWGTLETREVVLDRGRWFNSRTFHKLKEFWPKSSAKACSSQPFLVNFKRFLLSKYWRTGEYWEKKNGALTHDLLFMSFYITLIYQRD